MVAQQPHMAFIEETTTKNARTIVLSSLVAVVYQIRRTEGGNRDAFFNKDITGDEQQLDGPYVILRIKI